jgi:hypothetical protein
MKIVIITIDSKEIIDFVNENDGKEIIMGKKSYYIIESLDDIYYIWSNFTDNDILNDEYLYEFRVFCENDTNYDMFIFYKPEKMLRYKQTYRYQPIFKNEDILRYHYDNVKNSVLDIFKDCSYINNKEKLKQIENISKYDLLKKLPGNIYEFNFTDNSFKNKFKNNLCVIS